MMRLAGIPRSGDRLSESGGRFQPAKRAIRSKPVEIGKISGLTRPIVRVIMMLKPVLAMAGGFDANES